MDLVGIQFTQIILTFRGFDSGSFPESAIVFVHSLFLDAFGLHTLKK